MSIKSYQYRFSPLNLFSEINMECSSLGELEIRRLSKIPSCREVKNLLDHLTIIRNGGNEKVKKTLDVFKFGNQEVKVRENGFNLELDAEHIVRCLGFTTVANSGNETIRWSRVNEYLISFGYDKTVMKGDFLPETYVYLLAMKASNETAIKFQMWLASEVIPAIRKNKVYIDKSATDQEIDNAVRFATAQKRRNAIMDATIDGKQSVFVLYEDIKQYIDKWTGKEKITVYEHIERVLIDKQITYGNDVAFAHKIEELLRSVAKDLDKTKNWINGSVKRVIGKENKQLKEKIEYLEPDIEDFIMLPIHGFSENSMYSTLTDDLKVKTDDYNNWLRKFPCEYLPEKSDMNIDFTKPLQLIVQFDHLDRFDVINLDKSLADVVANHYGFNDRLIVDSSQKTRKYIDEFYDGRIYFILRNN